VTTWVALLRGINVSGQRKVAMADLRAVHEGLGHAEVVTYIQSGNVVFDADADAARLTTSIEEAVAVAFGFSVPVVVRTSEELWSAAAANPYPDAGADPQRVATAFLDAAPAAERVEEFDPDVHTPDVCVLDGREVHLFCPSGFGTTKLTNTYLERHLGVAATTRNWRTIIKLVELSDRD
jgi:uncharacterized protein (DUF1697 family)